MDEREGGGGNDAGKEDAGKSDIRRIWFPSPGVLPFGRKDLEDFANLYPS